MRLIFISKCSKYYVDFGNLEKNWEDVLSFWENCIWIGCVKHSLLPTEKDLSGVHKLSNSLKNSDTTKTEFFELKIFQSDQKI